MKAGAVPLTDAELEYVREWVARFNSPMETWVNIPPPPIQVNTRSLLATIDARDAEIERLSSQASRAALELSDEEVEAACTNFDKETGDGYERAKRGMRAALSAFLSARKQGET